MAPAAGSESHGACRWIKSGIEWEIARLRDWALRTKEEREVGGVVVVALVKKESV